MKILLVIGTGSFIGGIFRYLLSQLIHTKFPSSLPYGTLVVNILGCFFIGLIFALSERINLPQEWRLFLATGLIGGFTTFSAFSNETVTLIRDGQFWYATVYITASVLFGLFATFLGFTIIKLTSTLN
ncbi:MAG: hypothetical protein K0S53_1941 [Bacteroidetes bacterium]|jgi:CrcB protein|nr:hypothetical protein [Bacteroidota bacterium]MDF2452564.1 hypothetical protein [Bacteroidota bacterium]